MTDIDTLNMIGEYIQAINSNNLDYNFERKYNDIVKRINCSPLPSEEMQNFLIQHTLDEAKKIQIHNAIYKFNQKLNLSERCNYFVEYMRIIELIKKFSNPSQEMKKFISSENRERIRWRLQAPQIHAKTETIKQDIEEFYKKLRILSCEYEFEKNFDRICRMINQFGLADTQMIEFKQLDIRKIAIEQKVRKSIPRRFSSNKYISKKHWVAAREVDADFSRQLLRYKDYSVYQYNAENIYAFNAINKIIFEKLTEIISQIRKVYGNDFNIVLCACPSSCPEKTNTVQLSIAEFVKMDPSVLNCGDLLVRTQQIEPAHLSTDRSIAKHKNSIAINTNKYGTEFFNRKNIFIICDDIYTTGNTVNACKQYLLPKQTIANSIFIYTIAETEYIPDSQTNNVVEEQNGY